MTTAQDLVYATQRHLFTGNREELNTLAAGVSTNATNLTFTYPSAGIKVGASLEIGTELFYVIAVASDGSATVLPHQQGSTTATHSQGDVVTINPKFPQFHILGAINHDLDDLYALGLYHVGTVDITFLPPVYGYDLTGATHVSSIIDIRWKALGPSKYWPRITNYELLRDQDTTVFASGYALQLYETPQPGRQMRIRYRSQFTHFSTLSDDAEAVSGIYQHMEDLPPLGAAIELTYGREVKRNFSESQGDSRRATEVPPGAERASNQGLIARRLQRIMDEKARQHRADPRVVRR
jgi:hypothetical protein